MMRSIVSSLPTRSLFRPTTSRGVSGLAIRAFHRTPRHHGLREADRNRDEDLVEDIEQRTRKHKEDRERGEPKWEESLASNSEADVRADRDGFPDSKEVDVAAESRKQKGKKAEK